MSSAFSKHANVSIFVPHNGCPHKCTFCNQNAITGQTAQPTPKDVANTASIALESLGSNSKNAEIAFFGGSFTAIDREYMISLLEATTPFIDHFHGIRLSTRPDCIDDEVLKLLKEYKTTAIELGVQSMSDEVLAANRRGHTSDSVRKSCELIRKYDISLGLQMMTGLYKSTREDELYTAGEFISIKPDTVRIYPTVVIEGTKLACLYREGRYFPPALEESVQLCAELLLKFEQNGIRVIRLGLHSEAELAGAALSGAYHPAFRELCMSKIMLDNILSELKQMPAADKNITIYCAPDKLSAAVGHKKTNFNYLKQSGFLPVFKTDDSLCDYDIKITQR